MCKILSKIATFRVYIVEGRFRAPLFCAAEADSPESGGTPARAAQSAAERTDGYEKAV